jgi:hypothetical protein
MDVQKNTLELIRIQPTTFKGYDLVDIRIFYKDDEDNYKPTKKGVTFKQDLLEDVIQALNKVKAKVNVK